MVHKFLSYCKSHIYDLHALLAAGIAFLLIFAVKKPFKQLIAGYVDKKALKNEKWMQNKAVYRKRANTIIIILAIIVAYSVFAIISILSPLIDFSLITAFYCAVFTLDFYAVFEQLFGGTGNE